MSQNPQAQNLQAEGETSMIATNGQLPGKKHSMSEPIPPVAQRPLAVFLSFSGTGGVERMVVNLIRGFVDLGQPVDLLTVRAQGPHIERLPEQVNHVRLGTAHTQLAIPALARYLRRTRPPALLVARIGLVGQR